MQMARTTQTTSLAELPTDWLAALRGHLDVEDVCALRASRTALRRALPLTSVRLCPDTPLEDVHLLLRSTPAGITRLCVQYQRSPYLLDAPTPPDWEHTRALLAAAAPHLPGVQELVLANVAREDLEVLAALPPWRALQSVCVEGFGARSGLEEASRLAALGRALARWPALEHLSLVLVTTVQEFSPAAVQALARHVAPCCTGLKRFEVLLPPECFADGWLGRMSHQPDVDQALAAFSELAAAASHWQCLQDLTLRSVGLSAAALQQLARHAPQLQVLCLQSCMMGDSDDEVSVVAQALAAALLTWAPQLQQLELTQRLNSSWQLQAAASVALGRALAGCSALGELELPSGWDSKAVLAPLLAEPQPALQRLVVTCIDGAIAVMGAAHHLPSLQRLELWNWRETLCIGAALRHWPSLKHLILTGAWTLPALSAAIDALGPACPHLEELKICLQLDRYSFDETVISLARLAGAAPAWPALRKLCLDGSINMLEAGRGAHLPAAVRCWPQLQELSVHPHTYTYVTCDDGILPAAAGVLPGQLQRLDLGRRGGLVGAAGAQACCSALACRALQSPQLAHLSSLYMHNMQLGDEGAHSLAAAVAGMPQLLTLSACDCSIGAAGGECLLAALGDHCPQLCQLDLQCNFGLGNGVVQAWVQARAPAGKLEFLNLLECGLTAEVFNALCSLRWPRLQVLVLGHSFWERGLDVLAAAGQQFPALIVLYTGIYNFPPPQHARRWPMLLRA